MEDVFVKTGVLLLLIFIVVGGSQAFDSRYVKGQMAMRSLKLTEQKGKNVILTQNDVIRPATTRRFEDVSADSSYWLNRCVADYYGLKSIKMVLKKEPFIYGLPDE